MRITAAFQLRGVCTASFTASSWPTPRNRLLLRVRAYFLLFSSSRMTNTSICGYFFFRNPQANERPDNRSVRRRRQRDSCSLPTIFVHFGAFGPFATRFQPNGTRRMRSNSWFALLPFIWFRLLIFRLVRILSAPFFRFLSFPADSAAFVTFGARPTTHPTSGNTFAIFRNPFHHSHTHAYRTGRKIREIPLPLARFHVYRRKCTRNCQ